MKNHKKLLTIIAVFIFVLGIATIIGFVYITKEFNTDSQIQSMNKEYKYHYALIVEDLSDPFWEKVYNAAKAEGEKKDINVELFGTDISEKYSVSQLTDIAIAAGVDGIIVDSVDQPTSDMIAKANNKKIHVVTVLNDAKNGNDRIGFVGANSYKLGQDYGNEIKKYINVATERIIVLVDGNSISTSQNLICNSINETLKDSGKKVEIKEINNTNAFGAEESIRNIILNEATSPDILVCLSSVNTLCAYQAVVDYNQVGKINIIGSSDDKEVLDAIDKNIIQSAVAINAGQMGEKSVQVMYEYQLNGRVNEMNSIDTFVIDKQNVVNYLTGKDE